jgi:hypothetical protein
MMSEGTLVVITTARAEHDHHGDSVPPFQDPFSWFVRLLCLLDHCVFKSLLAVCLDLPIRPKHLFNER